MRPVPLWFFLILLVALAACGRQPASSSASADTTLPLQFTKALVARDYARAYAMTSQDYQRRVALETMRKSFEAIVPPGWVARGPAPMNDVTVARSMKNWPDKQPDDIAWVYIQIPGDAYSEGLVAILTREGNATKIRDIQWGRP
jgi:hypothetical protein